MEPAIAYMVIGLSFYSIVRLAVYSVSSNIHAIQQHSQSKIRAKDYYRPRISIIVPAHNESAVIERTLSSLLNVRYPRSRIEIIVANDGSSDDTARKVRSFAARHKKELTIRLVSRPNRGKAAAMNYAIRHRATGQLIMCLDADSIIHPDCVVKSVQYFRNKKVLATASNVNIIENGTLLGLIQRFEYLFSHHFKRSHTLLNMEYIIGGVGSTFRRTTLNQVQLYDSDTLTEDIDLTMKIIANKGNKEYRIIFAADAITYTEPVLSYKGLIKQRYRWKYGRLQTFYKNRSLFFSRQTKHNKQLTWFLMPTTLLYEILTLLEPLIIIYIISIVIQTRDTTTIFTAAGIFTALITANIWASTHVPIRDRIRLSFYAPAMYIGMYALTFVEYSTAMLSVIRIHKIARSLKSKHTTWKSPVRNADASVSI
ncbi:glycosyltransferase family 2 protein [bacterium]|nr:MAG: glycosyltransferase family 2 protein [bacterium]